MDRLAGGAALPEGFSLRMLGPQDAQEVIGLEVQIDEFADIFRGVDREEKVEAVSYTHLDVYKRQRQRKQKETEERLYDGVHQGALCAACYD